MEKIAPAQTPPPPAAKGWTLWGGRVLTAIPALMMLFSAALKLSQPPRVLEMFAGHLGYPADKLLGIALVEIACVIVFAIPRTAVLGAVLITGYLGGAISTHVRVGDPFVIPALLAIMAWGAVYLRDPRVRALLPLRQRDAN